MISIITSIIAIALVAGFLVATMMYIDMPFGLVNEHKNNAKISQQYIDFGGILNTADSLDKDINSNQDVIDFNSIAPELSGHYYEYFKTANGDRVFYNTHINAKDCLNYEKKMTNNKSLTIEDITKPMEIEDYVVNNKRNYSCYINSTGGRFVVFIYPFSYK